MIKFKLKPLNINGGKRYKSVLSSNEIRKRFVDYFVKENGHTFIKSSPVVPYNDPTIAFVNAGMCQFKSVLLGQRTLAANCVANSQKCIRVGGKHNDLNIVGSDGYHHSFFEMLGNWSFGYYGKKEACTLAWNLLTSPPFNIPADQLYCTIFNGDEALNIGTDNETFCIWKQIGVSDDHIIMSGAADNFWEMGETGPCGPCTEIHIDYPPSGGKNLIELWNIVFVQYSRERNSSMHKLPNCFIDTGMGLERLTMVLQNKTSTYDTDLFLPLFNTIFNACKLSKYTGLYNETSLDTYYRILADHGRMITVALSDNMLPSQNHKLRRIIRKSFLLIETNFKIQPATTLMCDIVDEVSKSLGNAYPELVKNNEKVKLLVKHEYSIFNKLRTSVLKDWTVAIEQFPTLRSFNPYEECTGFVPACNYLIKHKDMIHIPAFTLYDAFGLEKKTIGRLAEAMNKSVNWKEFEIKLKNLQTKTIKHILKESNNSMDKSVNIPKTNDSFKYEMIRLENQTYILPAVSAKLLAIVDINGKIVTEPDINKHGIMVSLVLDKTCFYCKAGGQQNDIGIVKTSSGKVFDVINCEKIQENGVVLHYIKSNDWPVLLCEKELTIQIDSDHRLGLMRAHSSVHILNSVLNKYLVATTQSSSCVKRDLMSFSFVLFGQKFTPEDALAVEKKVNSVIQSAASVKRITMTSNDLNQINVTLLPGEVYPDDQVYVIDMYNKTDGSYISREACCGTHVYNTLDLIDFCIVQYKCLSNECTLKAITGFLSTEARIYGDKLLEKLYDVENLVNSTNLNNNDPKKVHLLMDKTKSELNNSSQTYVPLKIQIIIDKKIFALERKIQKLMKEKKREVLGNAIKKLYKSSYAIGRVDCDTAYFEDNNFDFEDALHSCGEIPCLFLVYNKEEIHVFIRIPQELSEDENWLKDLWYKFKIKPIKFKNKVQFKATGFKIKQTDKCKALEIIDDVIQDAKKNYFSKIRT